MANERLHARVQSVTERYEHQLNELHSQRLAFEEGRVTFGDDEPVNHMDVMELRGKVEALEWYVGALQRAIKYEA